jgi:protein archease
VGLWTPLEDVAIADCALEIEGHSLDDLFATAGRAVAEVMADPATVPLTDVRTLAVTAPSLELLLYDWLSELLFLKDSEQMVFPRVETHVEAGSPCRLVATLRGSRLAPGTDRRADPKAMTLHRFRLSGADDGWRCSLVLDI